MEEPILQIRNLEKSFGETRVLRNISLDVVRGEKIVILGPSGSGKSTLLRCVNQLERYDGGQILFEGEPVDDPKGLYRLRESIGMVFQHFNIFRNMTALENVMVAPVNVKGVSREEALAEATRLLEKVGLAERVDARPEELSGGQLQRVAIARALAMHPDIMLFDEPTSALDPELVGGVLSVMRGVAQEGMTMVVVTHEMGFARDVADRVVFMEDGHVVADLPPDRFFDDQENDRVRQFIGKIQNA